MRTGNFIMMAMALVAAMASVQVSASSPQPSEETVGQTNNSFASDLYARLAGKDGNLFFSPTSIQTALAMTWAGARGQTADEMARALHLGGNDQIHEQLGGFLRRLNADGAKGGYELAVANALWGLKGYPFMPDYLGLVKRNYDST